MINGNVQYLREFMQQLPSPDNLYHALAERFMQGGKSTKVLEGFREVLMSTGDLSLRAQIAARGGYYPDVLINCTHSLGVLPADMDTLHPIG